AIVSSKDLIDKYTTNMWILISSTWHDEIEKQLKELGIKNIKTYSLNEYVNNTYIKNGTSESYKRYFIEEVNEFEKFYNMLEDLDSRQVFKNLIAYRISGNLDCLKESSFSQYFHPKVHPVKGDVIIDGGGFTGDTVKQFNNYLHSCCKIHSFVPSSNNYAQMVSFIEVENLLNVTAVQAGLGEKIGKFCMNPIKDGNNPGYSISTERSEEIMVISLDEYVEK
ncbi:hypothetical protein HMPREF9372_0953, partial [Sporosarcina newyorkensis 2681]